MLKPGPGFQNRQTPWPRELSSFIRRETDQPSLVALDTGATITRHRPHAATGEEIFLQLRSRGRVAEEVNGLSFKASGSGGQNDEKLKGMISTSISEVDERLQAFLRGSSGCAFR